jgi:hypothetical protein
MQVGTFVKTLSPHVVEILGLTGLDFAAIDAEHAPFDRAAIPPNVVHTSRNIGGPGWLIDVFAPPRVDFSTKPGLVCNADEYPMP